MENHNRRHNETQQQQQQQLTQSQNQNIQGRLIAERIIILTLQLQPLGISEESRQLVQQVRELAQQINQAAPGQTQQISRAMTLRLAGFADLFERQINQLIDSAARQEQQRRYHDLERSQRAPERPEPPLLINTPQSSKLPDKTRTLWVCSFMAMISFIIFMIEHFFIGDMYDR